MPSGHAEIGGSTIKRVMLCPGSVQLCATLPGDGGNKAAARGTMLHGVMEQRHKGRTFEDLLRRRYKVEGYEFTQADLAPAMIAFAAFTNFVKDASHVAVERRVVYRRNVWGTADILGREKKLNLVGDFKFGVWQVEVEDNPQMLFYVGAAVEDGSLPLRDTRMAIIAPEHKPAIETQVVKAAQITAFIKDVKKAAALAFSKKPPLKPHPDACQWCPAKKQNKCPAIHDTSSLKSALASLKNRV